MLVGKGEHFMFICHGDENDTTYNKEDNNIIVDHCSKFNLYRTYANTDNINITI